MNETTADSGRPPPLREELQLFPGPMSRDGAPTWTLQDPVSNQFFRLGWREFEILCRWRRGAPARIAELVSNETMLETTAEDVQELVNFLLGANLLRPQGERGVARLLHQANSKRMSGWQHLLHAYLFFRIPLFNPERILKKALPWVNWLFSTPFLIVSLLAGIVGIYFITRQWDVAMATFSETDLVTEMVFITLAMVLTKAVHELGHAFAATRHGCRVPTIGVAFLMLLPVLYTDTSEVWKLAQRRPRLIIAAAGMMAELLLTAWASIIWGALPSGAAKDALFFIATVSWVSTLLLNTSPFLRFDGYYLLSDWLEIENLHERAGRLGRWKLRAWLLGVKAPFPEARLYDQRHFLILFAWVTWIYRFFLYLGIALAVYHLFFKLLGIILMSVEIGWFLVRPIWAEMRAWMRPEMQLRLNKNLVFFLVILASLIALTLIPWQESIQAPALLQRERHVTLHAPIAARIADIRIREGQEVNKGAILLQLVSEDLENQLEILRHRIALLNWKIDFHASAPTLLKHSPTIHKELEIELSRQKELFRQKEQLTVTAPESGWVAQIGPEIKRGIWVAHGEPLATLADSRSWHAVAYIREVDLPKIKPGAVGEFTPEAWEWPSMTGQIMTMAPTAALTLEESDLFTQHGGALPVRRDTQGRWLPTTALYRIEWQPDHPLSAPPPHRLRGTLFLKSQRAENLVTRMQRLALEVLIRETGF
ncbi:MAG: HlyD family efflux transporter periplasmic adaptor subunit [Magnetococcales bacterium]|nr:HlyD family efflux transporter periplasmic adaptor subunit [Magnetococcales bacterium]